MAKASKKTTDSVEVRIAEWHEFIPTFPITAPGLDPDQAPPMLSAGRSGTFASDDEKLIDLSVNPVGNFQEILDPVTGKQTGVQAMYMFRAVFARNVNSSELKETLEKQRAPLNEEIERMKTQGRDKRKDLVVIEGKGRDNNGPGPIVA